jgi:hypothetical protein
MATNHYFQSGIPIGRRSEQNLYEDLIIECLKIYGFEVYYIPRKFNNIDRIFGEDTISSFEHAYPLEMYLQNVNGFEGDGELMSKFGVELKDTANFIVSRKRWLDTVGRSGNAVLDLRPAEGDILYFPLTKSFFEIRKVENETPFYQIGKLYVFTLQTELMQYSSEDFNTGISEIDDIVAAADLDISAYEFLLENGNTLTLEEYADTALILESYEDRNDELNIRNDDFDTDITDILDFTERNPFGEVYK